MGRIVYFDASAGAAGDMLLGALVDLGLPLEALSAELGKLSLTGYHLESRRVIRAGISASKVDVRIASQHHADEHAHPHSHHHPDRHHDDDHSPAAAHAHSGRHLPEIRAMLESSGLDAPIKQRSIALFERLGRAEAAVHGTTPDQVHFHEVGAIDSIVDIVGGVIGLHWLNADRFVCSPLNLGGGTVKMSHGVVGVPPPATARLVEGVPVFGQGDFERLTPTGALLLTGHATSYGVPPAMRIERTGTGAGDRDSQDRANVLRVYVGTEDVAVSSGRVLVLECEIDDLQPQLLGPLIERLLGAGALDAYFTPIHMKKGRPGILISVLAEPTHREAIEALLFAETSTLGVRRQEWDRTVLDREVVSVETPYGRVGVKVGRRDGRVLNAQPEFDDCQRAAAERRVPLKEVFAAALAAYRESSR